MDKKLKPLPLSFYQRPSEIVAPELLGKGFFSLVDNKPVLVSFTEVEAYLSEKDPASHSFCGITPRNRFMFETGGISYVYFIYGMYWCFNVVTGKKGKGEAVLIRGANVIYGEEALKKNRNSTLKNLLNGPGKFCQAFGISGKHNGWQLKLRHFQIVDLGLNLFESDIIKSPRIGITKGKELLLRFTIKEQK